MRKEIKVGPVVVTVDDEKTWSLQFDGAAPRAIAFDELEARLLIVALTAMFGYATFDEAGP